MNIPAINTSAERIVVQTGDGDDSLVLAVDCCILHPGIPVQIRSVPYFTRVPVHTSTSYRSARFRLPVRVPHPAGAPGGPPEAPPRAGAAGGQKLLPGILPRMCKCVFFFTVVCLR